MYDFFRLTKAKALFIVAYALLVVLVGVFASSYDYYSPQASLGRQIRSVVAWPVSLLPNAFMSWQESLKGECWEWRPGCPVYFAPVNRPPMLFSHQIVGIINAALVLFGVYVLSCVFDYLRKLITRTKSNK